MFIRWLRAWCIRQYIGFLNEDLRASEIQLQLALDRGDEETAMQLDAWIADLRLVLARTRAELADLSSSQRT